MADTPNKHPVIESVEQIETVLKKDYTIEELQAVLQQLADHLDTPGFLDKTQEIEITIARKKMEEIFQITDQMSGKKQRNAHRTVKRIKAKLESREQKKASVDSRPQTTQKDTQAPERTMEDLNILRAFDEQFRKYPETQVILDVMLGRTKLMKNRWGYNISRNQLGRIASQIISTKAGRLEQFENQRQDAIRKLAELQFSPNEIAPTDIIYRALLEKLKPYKATEETQPMAAKQPAPQSEPIKNKKEEDVSDLANEIERQILDNPKYEVLRVILFQEGEERLKALNKIGIVKEMPFTYKLHDTNELKEIVKHAIQGFFKTEKTPEEILSLDVLPTWLASRLANADQLNELADMIDTQLMVEAPYTPEEDGPQTKIINPAQLKALAEQTKETTEQVEWLGEENQPEDEQEQPAKKEVPSATETSPETTTKVVPPPVETALKDTKVVPPPAQKISEAPPKPTEAKGSVLKILHLIMTAAPKYEKELYQAISLYLEADGRKEEQELIALVLKMLADENKNNETTREQIKKRFNTFLQACKLKVDKNEPISEAWVRQFINNQLKPLQPQLEAAFMPSQQKPEIAEINISYESFYRGALKQHFNQFKIILEFKPADINDSDKREILIEIQEEVRALMEEIEKAFPLSQLQTIKKPTDKEKMVGKILEKIKEYEKTLKDFERFIQPATEMQEMPKEVKTEEKIPQESQEELSVFEVPPAELPTAEAILKPAAPAAPAPPQAEAVMPETIEKGSEINVPPPVPAAPLPIPATAPLTPSTEPQKPPPVEMPKVSESIEKTEEPVYEMIKNRLRKPELASNTNAECATIAELIQENGVDIKELEEFLKNPKDFVEIDMEAIEAAKTERGIEKPDILKKQLEQELKQLLQQINLFTKRNTRLTDEERTQFKTDLEKQIVLENLIDHIQLLIERESGSMRYNSPRQLLTLTYYFIHRGKEECDPILVDQELDERVKKNRDKLYSGVSAVINTIGSVLFLKPTLASTLRALAADPELAKIGEDKLAELAKWFKGDFTEVEEWIKSLDGGLEKHIKTTVPRLIAYLEMGIRNGKSGILTRTARAEKLVGHLKMVQREYAMNQIEAKGISDEKIAMMEYVRMMNEMHREGGKISEKILKYHAAKSIAGTAALYAGIALAPFTFFGTIPAAAAVAAMLGKKKFPKEWQPQVEKIAHRTAVASGIYIAGAMSGALWLGLPLAAVAVAPGSAKWLWKKRETIYEKGLKPGAKAIGKGAWFGLKYFMPWGPFMVFRDVKKYFKNQ